jgi:hypothetical protein
MYSGCEDTMPAPTTITYRGVELKIGRVTTFRQRAVYDDTGKNYLYTHFFIVCRCVWNPTATTSPDPANPFENALPAVAMTQLRERLLTPRGVLVLQVGDDVLLESPLVDANGARYEMDANNGPAPVSCDVISFHGVKSMVVDFTIETWVSECQSRDGGGVFPAPSILAHEWEATEEIDELYMSTRTITGRVIFRTDFLAFSGLGPDDYRQRLFHPIPSRFRRVSQKVTQDSDGTSIRYTVVDEEEPWGIGGGTDVLKMEGDYQIGYDWVGPSNPIFMSELTLEVWGRRGATNAFLGSALLLAYTTMTDSLGKKMNRSGVVGAGRPDIMPTVACSFRHSMPRRYARLHVRRQVSGAAGGMAALNQLAAAVGLTNANRPKPPENFGVVGGPAITTFSKMRNADVNRSEALIALVAQAINGECGLPAAPANRVARTKPLTQF